MGDLGWLLVYLFALFGAIIAVMALVGGIMVWVEERQKAFKYTEGDKVSTVKGSPLFCNVRVDHFVVVTRYNSKLGRKYYLVVEPKYAPVLETCPVEIKRENELHMGWL